MKFAHIADCHLGGWRQPQLKHLNFESFKVAIDKIIKEKVDFLLIAGDLFDSAYPPIDTLKDAFQEFKKLREARIPVFLIAGSHDYSVSGKTFLEVLEKAGFCKNVAIFEEKNGKIMLEPFIYKNIAIYGYPGRKSGLEVDDIERIKIQDAPGMIKILMLHTTIRDAIGNIPVKAVDETQLPRVDYLALGHLHIIYHRGNRVYAGPTFPNSLAELEELKGGSFYIIEDGQIRREDIRLKDVVVISQTISNALEATDEILQRIEKEKIKDKVVILKLSGFIQKGKTSDIDFNKIDRVVEEKGAYVFLRSTSKLHLEEAEMIPDSWDSSELETQIIKKFEEQNPSVMNELVNPLIKSLQTEKAEDEKSATFEERLLSELRKILLI